MGRELVCFSSLLFSSLLFSAFWPAGGNGLGARISVLLLLFSASLLRVLARGRDWETDLGTQAGRLAEVVKKIAVLRAGIAF